MECRPLSKAQKFVLSVAFVPMLATGVAGAWGTYSNISGAYGRGTALGAVAAGEGATAVLAITMLALTMLGQSSPLVVRAGLWTLPAAASVMAAMAAEDPGRTVIYAVTPMGMCVAAEGMAFVARRIVVFQTGRDAEAEASAAALLRSLAYHRARAANHPDEKVRARSDKTSWRLARKAGAGDTALDTNLLGVQRTRVTTGADTALGEMYTLPGVDRPERPAVGGDEATSAPEPVPVRSLVELLDDIEWASPPVQVTTERLDQPRGEVVSSAPGEVTTEPDAGHEAAQGRELATVPANQPRPVVTEKVVATPSELRRKARCLHRKAVADGGRGVTIDQLRTELSLSRRDAAELRRDIVNGVEA